jgi:5-methylcytosine-specific restriction protein B
MDVPAISLMSEEAEPRQSQELAAPFNSIFQDLTEAEWSLDLIAQSLRLLGVEDPNDKRFAITTPAIGSCLRLNFANWAVLQFYGPENLARVGIAFVEDSITLEEIYIKLWTFEKSDPKILVYGLSIEQAKSMDTAMHQAYETTFVELGNKFGHWKASPYRKFNQPEIAEAVFDPAKRLALLTGGLVVNSLDEDEDEVEEEKDEEGDEPEVNEVYTLAQMATETGMDEPTLHRWVQAINRKGQAILYGPPGTGKTFVAQRLARHLIGGGDGLVELVQFHPSYAYEDFIQGIRPELQAGGGLGYRLVPGRFMEFCQQAAGRNDTSVLIIDELNRANLSRVFGELMYLLEYRNEEVALAGGNKRFSIPEQVRIIGTMNTADRSIALVDHALRRRFAFLALQPNFEVVRRFHQDKRTGFPVEKLITELNRLNQHINDGNYAVGISFFLRDDLRGTIGDIWQMEVEPYLEEYFFDRPEAVGEFRWAKLKDKIGV